MAKLIKNDVLLRLGPLCLIHTEFLEIHSKRSFMKGLLKRKRGKTYIKIHKLLGNQFLWGDIGHNPPFTNCWHWDRQIYGHVRIMLRIFQWCRQCVDFLWKKFFWYLLQCPFHTERGKLQKKILSFCKNVFLGGEGQTAFLQYCINKFNEVQISSANPS